MTTVVISYMLLYSRVTSCAHKPTGSPIHCYVKTLGKFLARTASDTKA